MPTGELFAAIDADGSINWSKDSGLVSAERISEGTYKLTFRGKTDHDVFVLHPKTEGIEGDAESVIASSVQGEEKVIYVYIRNTATMRAADAFFSYIRYSKSSYF